MRWLVAGMALLLTQGLVAAAPNLICEKRIGEMTWEGMVFHRYHLRAENFPPEKKYRLIVASFDGTTTETFTYVANNRGHLILVPPENVEGDLYAICPAKRGERLTFLMKLEGGDEAVTTDVIPFPIRMKSKKGAKLSLELHGEKGETFLFLAERLKPREEVQLTLVLGEHEIPLDAEVTQSGDLWKEVHLLEDPDGGEAKLVLKRKNEEAVLHFEWGAPALKLVGACCFEIK